MNNKVQYLDENGLKIVWSKTKAKIGEVDSKVDAMGTKVGAIEDLPLEELNEILGIANLITFTYYSNTRTAISPEDNFVVCQAKEGMTWREFVDSEYNPYNPSREGVKVFSISDGVVDQSFNGAVVWYEGTQSVKADDVIVADAIYCYCSLYE